VGQRRTVGIRESLVLGVAIVAVSVGYGRFYTAASEFAVSYAETGTWYESQTVLEDWWGGRFFPQRVGGDYLGVLGRFGHRRLPNYVIGPLLEERGQTGEDQALIVPEDFSLTSQSPEMCNGQRIDDTSVVLTPGLIGLATRIPLETRAYDPALDETLWAELTDEAEGPYPGDVFYIAPPDNGSGVFVLHTNAERNARLIVPLEYSPVVRP